MSPGSLAYGTARSAPNDRATVISGCPLKENGVVDRAGVEVVIGCEIGDCLTRIDAFHDCGGRDAATDDDGPAKRNPRIDRDRHLRTGGLCRDERRQSDRESLLVPRDAREMD